MTVPIHQELDRTGTGVVDSVRRADGRLAQGADEPIPHPRWRRLLQQLLMAALNRTVAGTEVDDVVVLIRQDLHLNVAGFPAVLLSVQVPTAERCFGLRLGPLQGPAVVLAGVAD